MAFKLDEQTLTLSGRVGESLNLTFEFEDDISQMCIEFIISEKMGLKPLLRKSLKKPQENTIEVNLTTDEVKKLFGQSDSHKAFCWGLMTHIGKYFSDILIPQTFESAPKLLIYPGINMDESGEDDEN